jgi:hypothetical protein
VGKGSYANETESEIQDSELAIARTYAAFVVKRRTRGRVARKFRFLLKYVKSDKSAPPRCALALKKKKKKRKKEKKKKKIRVYSGAIINAGE